MDHPIRAAAREVDHALKSVADVNPAFMTTSDKAAALVELSALESRIAELRLRITADASDVAEVTGARDVGAWSAAATRRRRSDCAADLRLARALEGRALLSAALREGAVNADQARAVVSSLDDLPADLDAEIVDRAEAALIGYAAELDPIQLRRLGRRIVDVVAPEVAEAVEARHLAGLEASARDRMRLSLRSAGDGTTRITGLLPDADAARLVTYLHAFTSPRRDQGDSRSVRVPYGRRAAAAFCQLLETLDPTRLPLHGGEATTVVVTMTLDALRADLATATLATPAPGDSVDRITAAQARRLACTARLVPAVLGADSEVLDLGRSQRLYTRAQRRALSIRDGQCRAEHCHVPAPWCEAHHLHPWSQGGHTDLDDGVLLCSHHHHRAHDPTYITERHPDGSYRFHRRT
jgi:hypothetical protein